MPLWQGKNFSTRLSNEKKINENRYKLFAMRGYMVRNGNLRILKLLLSIKRRNWFLWHWDKTSRFALPVILEN